jgi:hypothetical protein
MRGAMIHPPEPGSVVHPVLFVAGGGGARGAKGRQSWESGDWPRVARRGGSGPLRAAAGGAT